MSGKRLQIDPTLTERRKSRHIFMASDSFKPEAEGQDTTLNKPKKMFFTKLQKLLKIWVFLEINYIASYPHLVLIQFCRTQDILEDVLFFN